MSADRRNLAVLAEQALVRHGDYDSVFFEGTWHRSVELFERSRRLAGGLTELGVAPGDRVVVLMSNSPDVGDHPGRADPVRERAGRRP
jgi:long-chain acyl-CoA synthetase